MPGFIKRWAVIVLCFVSASVHAEDEFLLFDVESYGISENDFDRMQIVPTHMMETDTLFRAADAEKDASMNMSQRLINNRWLLDEKKYSYTGTEALRRYLRMYFVQHWKSAGEEDFKQYNLALPIVKRQEPSQFSDVSNYQLKVSDDKVRIKFRYKFD